MGPIIVESFHFSGALYNKCKLKKNKIFSTMTLSIKGLFVTISINNNQHETLCIECSYAECHILFLIILSALLQNVIMLSVVGICWGLSLLRAFVSVVPSMINANLKIAQYSV